MIYLICNSLGGQLNKFDTGIEEDPLKAYAAAVDVPVTRLRRWGIQAVPLTADPPKPIPLAEQPTANLEKILQSVELRWYALHKTHQELLCGTSFLGAQLTSLRRLLNYSRKRVVKEAQVPFDVLRASEEGWLKPEHTASALKLIRFYHTLLNIP